MLRLRLKNSARWKTPGLMTREVNRLTAEAVDEAGGGASDIVRGVLSLRGLVATRELWTSVRATYRQGNADFYREGVQMRDYGLDLDTGTRPHWPNITRLARWAVALGLPPEAVYPIALWISRRGTRATHFLRDATRLFEHRAAQIRAALGRRIARALGGN